MSGGAFEYQQYRLHDIAQDIEEEIKSNGKEDEHGYKNNYSKKTLTRFKNTVILLKKVESMVQRVDWLLCGDDSEDTFHERWEKEVLK